MLSIYQFPPHGSNVLLPKSIEKSQKHIPLILLMIIPFLLYVLTLELLFYSLTIIHLFPVFPNKN